MLLWLMLLLEPELRRVCVTLELFGPHEYCARAELIETAVHNYRELRNAPSLIDAEWVQDHSTCTHMAAQFELRICALEKQRDYFGSYRWQDFETALQQLRNQLRYWEDCAEATGSGKWKDRRLALQRLRGRE